MGVLLRGVVCGKRSANCVARLIASVQGEAPSLQSTSSGVPGQDSRNGKTETFRLPLLVPILLAFAPDLRRE